MLSWLSIFLFCFISDRSFAIEKDIFSVAEEFNSSKKSVVKLEQKKRSVLAKMYSLERNSKKIVKEKGKLKKERIILKKNIKNVSGEIVGLEVRVRKLTRILHERWEFMQKMQDLPWLYIFLSSYSPVDLERAEKVFSKLNRSEAHLAVNYVNDIESMKVKKQELQSLVKNMISVEKNINSQENRLKQTHLEKKKMLGSLEGQITKTKNKLSRAKDLGLRLSIEQKMENLRLLFTTSFFDKKGQLGHPIVGKVIHHYGLNQSLLSENIELIHKGYFYRAPKNTPVQAIERGRVSFLAPAKGMGLVAIVDHGSNYYSVYSHLSKKTHRKGDIVDAGETLGMTGHKSRQFGYGLYFEIRHFSEAENPKDWLKKNSYKDQLAQKIKTVEGGI